MTIKARSSAPKVARTPHQNGEIYICSPPPGFQRERLLRKFGKLARDLHQRGDFTRAAVCTQLTRDLQQQIGGDRYQNAAFFFVHTSTLPRGRMPRIIPRIDRAPFPGFIHARAAERRPARMAPVAFYKIRDFIFPVGAAAFLFHALHPVAFAKQAIFNRVHN